MASINFTPSIIKWLVVPACLLGAGYFVIGPNLYQHAPPIVRNGLQDAASKIDPSAASEPKRTTRIVPDAEVPTNSSSSSQTDMNTKGGPDVKITESPTTGSSLSPDNHKSAGSKNSADQPPTMSTTTTHRHSKKSSPDRQPDGGSVGGTLSDSNPPSPGN